MDAVQRDESGHYLKGNPPGPGRKPLPAWLKTTESSDALLRVQFLAATTGRIPLAAKGDDDEPDFSDDGEALPMTRTQVVPPNERLRAAESLLNRIHGRAPLVAEVATPPADSSRLAKLYAAADAIEAMERAAPSKPDAE